jgi:hypothetical protein
LNVSPGPEKSSDSLMHPGLQIPASPCWLHSGIGTVLYIHPAPLMGLRSNYKGELEMLIIIIQNINAFSHKVNPGNQEESRSPKFILGSDMASIWVWRSLRTSDAFAELSGMYTQHFVLINAQFPPKDTIFLKGLKRMLEKIF